MLWILGAGIFVLMIALLTAMPVRADFFYKCEGTDGIVKAKIFFFGGLLKLTLAETKPEEKIKMCLPMVKSWLRRVRDAIPALKPIGEYLLSRTVIRRLSWQTQFGLGNAAYTGILTGLVWGLNSTIINWLYYRVRRFCLKPQLSVVPVFSAETFSMEFHCIFEVRVGHIIIAGATAIRKIRQRRG